MSNKQKVSFKSTLGKATIYTQKLRPYSFAFFILFIILVYGFVLLRINNLSNAQPSSEAVSAQVKAGRTLRIDTSLIQQIQSLQDNSVSIHALFDQARSNPFQ